MRQLFIGALFCVFVLFGVNAKTGGTDKSSGWAENKFQFGIGGTMSTGNLLGVIETFKMMQADAQGDDYKYPGMTDEEIAAYNNLTKNMKQAIWTSNLLASMEYSLQARILWKFFMFHADWTLLPMDASYNGRLDNVLGINGGLRLPFFIMPYITAGVNFTFSFYPDAVANIDTEKWKLKAGYGVAGNFVFRPGINIVGGLELKLGKFSFGGFYKYIVKDFGEFTYWYNELKDSRGDAAAGMIFSAQSRFGIAATIYF